MTGEAFIDLSSLITSGTVSEVLLRDMSGRLLRKVSSYEKEEDNGMLSD